MYMYVHNYVAMFIWSSPCNTQILQKQQRKQLFTLIAGDSRSLLVTTMPPKAKEKASLPIGAGTKLQQVRGISMQPIPVESILLLL